MGLLLGDIGTIEWSQSTRGVLDRTERVRFSAALTLTTARVTPRMLVAKLGVRGSGPDPSGFDIPDTALTRDVLEACHDLDPMIVEHGYRSYLFARALGAVEQLECDHEALFVAAVLHDYAFSTMDTLTDRCFTVAGAEVAAGLLQSSSLSAALRHDVLDAMTLHLNPTVRPEQGVLQHLLHDGILIDVIGARSWELDPAGVQRAVEAHPRHGFNLRGEPLMRAHGKRVRGCRSGALFACGFGPALRLGPWRARERTERRREVAQ